MKLLLVLTTAFTTIMARAQDLDLEVKKAIIIAAKKYKVPEWDLLKIAYVESHIRKSPPVNYNKNNTYDIGIMQINSTHWYTTCKELDVTNLIGNVSCSAKILAYHYKSKDIDNNYLARYNSCTYKYKMAYLQKLNEAEMYLKQTQVASSWAPSGN